MEQSCKVQVVDRIAESGDQTSTFILNYGHAKVGEDASNFDTSNLKLGRLFLFAEKSLLYLLPSPAQPATDTIDQMLSAAV